MPSLMMHVLALLGAVALIAPCEGVTTGLRKNPIRKVVTMLQDMQKSVEEEGEKEEDLFDKFMCYCSNGEGALDASIQAGKAQIEQLGSAIEKGTVEEEGKKEEITAHKTDREGAQSAVKE